MTEKLSVLFLILVFVFTPIDFDNIFSQPQKAQALEEITEDTIWSDDRTIEDPIMVGEDATLTIKKGLTITFKQNTSLLVSGKLNVEGTVMDPVKFRGENGYSGYSIQVMSPGEIKMRSADISGGGSVFSWFPTWNDKSLIKKAYAFVFYTGVIAVFSGGKVEMENSYIHDNKVGFSTQGSVQIKVNRSKIKNNEEYDVYKSGSGSADFRYNWWGSSSGPDLDKIYGSINYSNWTSKEDFHDPVIIVPGIMGSWNLSGEWQLDPILNTYDNLWEALKLAGYTEDETLFAFPYQWRDSNIQNAQLLKDRINEIKQATNWPKVDVVSHSMGGLLTREYIESDYYQNDIDQLIFLAVPHKGATKTYLTWEGGDLGPRRVDKLQQKILTLEALKNGYIDIYNYVRKLPMQSVQELLPIYDYLRDKDTMELRTYPDNYPINTFLEILNNSNQLENLDNVSMVNIIADAGADSTISSLRVVDNWVPLDPKWEYGKPENYNTPFTDHGLEYGAGDITVPERSNIDFMGLDNVIIESDHNDIVTDAQKQVIEELTGIEPTEEVRMNIFKKFLLVRIFSPADFMVIAPDGKRVGKDFAGGEAVNEIDGAFYSGFDGDIEFAVIPEPMDGEYEIELEGTGDGEYTLSASFIDDEQDIDRDFTGNIQIGQNQRFNLVYDSEGEELIGDLEPETAISIDSTIADIEAIYEKGWITKTSDKKLLIRQLKHLERKLKHFNRKTERIEKLIQKTEDNPSIEPEIKQKILKRLNRRLEKINEQRQRTIDKRLNLLERILNRMKIKDGISEQGYDIIMSDINYLRENI